MLSGYLPRKTGSRNVAFIWAWPRAAASRSAWSELAGYFGSRFTNRPISAKGFVAADPVIVNGEMVAEYHKFFSSAGLMAVNDIHNKIRKK